MTDTPIADRTEADLHPAPPPQRPPSLIARVHHDLAAVGHVVTRMVPVLEGIAANPQVDEGVSLLLSAAGLGAEAHDLAPVLAVLRDLIARKQAERAAPPPAIAQDVQADGSEGI